MSLSVSFRQGRMELGRGLRPGASGHSGHPPSCKEVSSPGVCPQARPAQLRLQSLMAASCLGTCGTQWPWQSLQEVQWTRAISSHWTVTWRRLGPSQQLLWFQASFQKSRLSTGESPHPHTRSEPCPESPPWGHPSPREVRTHVQSRTRVAVKTPLFTAEGRRQSSRFQSLTFPRCVLAERTENPKRG